MKAVSVQYNIHPLGAETAQLGGDVQIAHHGLHGQRGGFPLVVSITNGLRSDLPGIRFVLPRHAQPVDVIANPRIGAALAEGRQLGLIDERAKELGAKYPLLSRRERAERRIKKSGSASVPGVRRILKRHSNREYPFWEALWWSKPGVVMKKSFSIFKYGAKEARKLAIEARLAGIMTMRD